MKSVINSFLMHVFLSFLFSFVYFFMGEDQFEILDKTDFNYSHYLNLSVTTQAGVGITRIIPKTLFAQIIFIIQQFVKMGAVLINIFIIAFESKSLKKIELSY